MIEGFRGRDPGGGGASQQFRRALVHIGDALASGCMGAWEGRPDWKAGALGEADGVHGSSLELAFDEQDGIR